MKAISKELTMIAMIDVMSMIVVKVPMSRQQLRAGREWITVRRQVDGRFLSDLVFRNRTLDTRDTHNTIALHHYLSLPPTCTAFPRFLIFAQTKTGTNHLHLSLTRTHTTPQHLQETR